MTFGSASDLQPVTSGPATRIAGPGDGGRRKWGRWALVVLAVSTLAGGCQSGAAKPARPVSLSDETLAATDPCANRLHDLIGALLMYYTLNKHLPPRLEDVRSFGDMLSPVELTCPTTNQPYVYIPVANLNRRDPKYRWLLVYDSVPHEGRRWGIVAAPARPADPVTMWVVPMEESTFERLRRDTVSPATEPAPEPVRPQLPRRLPVQPEPEQPVPPEQETTPPEPAAQ